MASCLTSDLLSNLRENILESILLRLSIKNVVRTSVLSTKWRYKWISVPHLSFEEDCIPLSTGSCGHDILVKIVNQVLLIRRGPIMTFRITSSHLQTCSEIDNWILYLSLFNSVKDFKLMILKSERHNVPPCFFSLRQLILLTLAGCKIVHPVRFKGFSCLKILIFGRVTLSNATFECLVSTCPQLEMLRLVDIDGPTHIELSNPKLKYLMISGKFIDVCLKDLRTLVSAKFWATHPYPGQRGTCKFTNILGSLLGIQELSMHGWYLQSLAIGDVPRRLPFTYDHMKRLSFSLNEEDMKEILIAICLLKSSPILQELEIQFRHGKEYAIVAFMDLQKAKDQLKCTFNKLRIVNISSLLGGEFELELIKFILANSPVLETMNISPSGNIDKVLMLKELLQFKRASPQAEIVYLDLG